jgi:cysteine synthase
MKVMNSILEQIGNTPLVKLKKVTAGLDMNVYVKCEYLNPSGSYKDRVALRMIEEAEKAGRLQREGTIIEGTSGNSGPAIALVGAVKGYKVRLFVRANWVGTYNPSERIKIMKFFGADVETYDSGKIIAEYEGKLKGFSEQDKGVARLLAGMKNTYEIEKSDPKNWWPNQMCNPDSTAAHRDTTGKEIWEQLDGKVDAWVGSVGSGSCFLGVAEALRKGNPSVSTVSVQPSDLPIVDMIRAAKMNKLFEVFDMPRTKFIIETMLEKKLPDRVMNVGDEHARPMAYRLCAEEGLFCGFSSGANVYAAIQVAKKLPKNSNVVTVIVDRRDRYFSEYPNEHYVV